VSSNLKPLLLATFVAASAATAFAAQPISTAAAGATDSKERTRLEELFIWKTSEELRLAPADEQKFTDAIHDLNKKRKEANAKMDAALTALASAKTKVEAEKALASHRAALRDSQGVQNAELDRLRPLLGPEKLARYVVAKNSILEKLKSMLAAPQTIGVQAPAPASAPVSSSAASAVTPSSASASTTPASSLPTK
jgi:Spy/CpxP family protein refolding chaperone